MVWGQVGPRPRIPAATIGNRSRRPAPQESEGTTGKWEATAGKWFKDEAEDKGIQTAEDSKFFGIATSFPSFSNEGKDLIIQYQAKYEKDVECGGGYLKIGPKLEDLTSFSDARRRPCTNGEGWEGPSGLGRALPGLGGLFTAIGGRPRSSALP